MRGTAGEAEEVVQDAWLRWNDADRRTIHNAEAWLVAITTRVAIDDRLRAAKRRREHHVGFWLPEPQLAESPASPEPFRTFAAFGMALNDSSSEAGLRHRVEIRASQTNGCGLCVDMHVQQATIHGERPLRLHHLVIWRESTRFAPRAPPSRGPRC